MKAKVMLGTKMMCYVVAGLTCIGLAALAFFKSGGALHAQHPLLSFATKGVGVLVGILGWHLVEEADLILDVLRGKT